MEMARDAGNYFLGFVASKRVLKHDETGSPLSSLPPPSSLLAAAELRVHSAVPINDTKTT